METFLDCPSHSECLENPKNDGGRKVHSFMKSLAPTCKAMVSNVRSQAWGENHVTGVKFLEDNYELTNSAS